MFFNEMHFLTKAANYLYDQNLMCVTDLWPAELYIVTEVTRPDNGLSCCAMACNRHVD